MTNAQPCFLFLCLIATFLMSETFADGSTNAVPERFLGPQSCSSSSCHGGAGDKSCQYSIWSKLDFHSRSYATLTTARSARFSDVLKLADAISSPRCTACHAPQQTIPMANRVTTLHPSDGVTCENCHGAAEDWLRTHTRPDLSHTDRVAAGMRDLKNLYVRANTCVACHQNVDIDLLNAGHPELTFELDGQAASEPRHWKETQDHGQIWLVGQLVALREMSWQLAKTPKDEKLIARWRGLSWLMQKTLSAITIETRPNHFFSDAQPDAETLKKTQEKADAEAKQVADSAWTGEMGKIILSRLIDSANDFKDPKVEQPVQARRAERLALALDRLSRTTQADKTLNKLFSEVQSLPDFDAPKFAETLAEFAASNP